MSAREKLLQKFGTRWKEIELEGEKVLVKLLTRKEAKEYPTNDDDIIASLCDSFLDPSDHKPIFTQDFLKGECGDAAGNTCIQKLVKEFWMHNGGQNSKN